MNPSKENARKALDKFTRYAQEVFSGPDVESITAFLEAAVRKLPKEKSFARDKQRRKSKA